MEELNEEGQARRRFLKQAGTVAWASPFVVTMMSRAANASHDAVCGTQAGTPGSFFCNVSQPCGSAHACIPDAIDPGGNCICQSVPSP